MATAAHGAEGAQSPLVTNTQRGKDLITRRLALDIQNPHQFAKATGRDYQTIVRAEEGGGSRATYESLEAWLDREEAARGVAGPGPIKIRMHGLFGMDEMIVEGPLDRPQELAEAVSVIMERLRRDSQN